MRNQPALAAEAKPSPSRLILDYFVVGGVLANSFSMPAKIFETSFFPEPQETAFPPERAISIETLLELFSAGTTFSTML
jgi:hypothetical protein